MSLNKMKGTRKREEMMMLTKNMGNLMGLPIPSPVQVMAVKEKIRCKLKV